MVNLYDVLKSSFGNKKNETKLINDGYIYDDKLSNGNNKVYYNPNQKKLIHTVKGTNPFSFDDIKTDVALAFGGLKNTDRYKDSKRILNQSKEKYKGYQTNVAGHSLGCSISSNIASKNDKVFALDEGKTFFQPTRSYAGNHQHFRSKQDVVSLF